MCVCFFDFFRMLRRKEKRNRRGEGCCRRKGGRTAALLLTLLLICSGIWNDTQTVCAKEGEEELLLYSQAAVLMDADSGRVLYGKNEKQRLPMASTTKIMTCILALEYGNTEQQVEVSAYAAGMPKVKLNASAGERFRMGDLLYSLMLESHNDSAVVIAEAVGGSVEEFAGMMNQKARDIGCSDTCFLTPNGLDAENTKSGEIHSTTAEDLARIMAYCIKESPAKEQFLEITRTMNYQFTDAEGKHTYQCTNHNAYLTMDQDALSGKTGFTNKAGYCYVGALESEGRTFTVALLACGWPSHRTYKWSDMAQLASYGREHYRCCDIREEQHFEPIPVRNGIMKERGNPYETAYVMPVQENGAEEPMTYLLSDRDQVEVQCEVKKELTAPVSEGDSVGRVSYYLNGQLIRQYEVICKNGVKECTMADVLQYLADRFLLWGA